MNQLKQAVRVVQIFAPQIRELQEILEFKMDMVHDAVKTIKEIESARAHQEIEEALTA